MSKLIASLMLFLGIGCMSAGYLSKDPNERNLLMTAGAGLSGGSTIALVSAVNEDKKLKYEKGKEEKDVELQEENYDEYDS